MNKQMNEQQVFERDARMAAAWKSYSMEHDEYLCEMDTQNEDDQMKVNEYAWCEICSSWEWRCDDGSVGDEWCIAAVVEHAFVDFVNFPGITREMVEWAIEGALVAELAFCDNFADRQGDSRN